ncbi:hypothetical protein KI387_012414 [Taxus chinensis]|uniref:Uncharacterized protein n=1 Tax=Taxus chinensis TaxID=29808 RepID=A0AA38CG44_TAXCH|nr:hypothetical protein KI387_012414 [Taxus chinensis]
MEGEIWQLHRSLMDDVDGEGRTSLGERKSSLGFPLGTALVILIVLGISALFSCCYHWERIRSFPSRTNSSSSFPEIPMQDNLQLQVDAVSPSSSKNPDIEQNQSRSLPVLMPGDEMPKFIAWPAPVFKRMN